MKEHNDYRFAKQDFNLQHPSLLRTDGVYIDLTTGENYKGDTVKGYSFYKFYKNGRCFASKWREGIPNDDTLRLTANGLGQRTFYRIEGSDLIVEMWGGEYTGYIFHYCELKKDRIIVSSYKSRGITTSKINYPEPFVYIFRPLDLDSLPNW